MEILKYPHPSLFKKCSEVRVFGPELKVLVNAMIETMIKSNGAGLAANQVGLEHRIFVMLLPNGDPLALINPRISDMGQLPANLREGCLSAPGEFLILPERKRWVKVYFQDLNGKEWWKVFTDIQSVCVQHEIDHLDGKSHLQSASITRAQRKLLAKKWGFKLK